MKNIRVDSQGRQRCWNCGGASFNMKRTVRVKFAGPAAMAAKKKLKCLSCGEFNDVGNAQPYKGPKSKRAAKKSGALLMDEHDTTIASQGALTAQAMQAIVDASQQQPSPVPQPAVQPGAAAIPPPPDAPAQVPEVVSQPADWYRDPAGRFEYRYWNGEQWTDHVSSQGVVSQDLPV